MQKILLTIILLGGLLGRAYAQKSFIGIGGGLNNFNGLLGISADVGVTDKFAFRAGAGIGSWGTKLGIGFLVRPMVDSDWRFGLTYTSASGLLDFETELEVNGNTQLVLLDLYRQRLFNISAVKDFPLKNQHVIQIEFGYSINLEGAFFYAVKDGTVLDHTSKTVLNILRPGGLSIGVSYNFSLAKKN